MRTTDKVLPVKTFPESEVRSALTEFWKKNSKEKKGGPFDEPDEGDTLYNLVPALDSITTVRSFVVVSKILQMKVPIDLVKRGGYDSREEMLSDLVPKLQRLWRTRKNKTTK